MATTAIIHFQIGSLGGGRCLGSECGKTVQKKRIDEFLSHTV